MPRAGCDYGAGTVETWDRSPSRRVGDAAAGLRGGVVLVRLKPRPKDTADNWLLIEEHDGSEQAGETAAIEAKPPAPPRERMVALVPPAAGAVRGDLPSAHPPQLATPVRTAPEDGALRHAGGAGAGFSDRERAMWRKRLEAARAGMPAGLRHAGERPPPRLSWVRPEWVVEVRYAGWSGAGRLRRVALLGVREDRPATDVVRALPGPEAERREATSPKPAARIVAPKVERGEALTHADKELWPGITKRDLADAGWRGYAARTASTASIFSRSTPAPASRHASMRTRRTARPISRSTTSMDCSQRLSSPPSGCTAGARRRPTRCIRTV